MESGSFGILMPFFALFVCKFDLFRLSFQDQGICPPAKTVSGTLSYESTIGGGSIKSVPEHSSALACQCNVIFTTPFQIVNVKPFFSKSRSIFVVAD